MATTTVPFSFTEGFEILTQIGFFEVILPFLLFFALSYGALLRAKIFVEPDQKKINILIAMAFGLFMSVSLLLVGFTQEFLPWVGVFLIIGLGVIMAGGLFLGEDVTGNKYIKWMGGLGAMAAVLYFAGFTLGFFEAIGSAQLEIPGWTWSVLIVIALIVFPVLYVIGLPGSSKKKD